MATPKHGSKQIDEEGKAILAAMKKLDKSIMRNLDFKLIGKIVEESNRIAGLSIRYYGVRGSQKQGGHVGAERAKG